MNSDAGQNIYSKSEEITKKMKAIAKLLNLSEHTVYNLSNTKKTTIYTPVDIEGHLGKDGR